MHFDGRLDILGGNPISFTFGGSHGPSFCPRIQPARLCPSLFPIRHGGERIVSIGPATTELILALGASRAWSPPMSAVRSPEACQGRLSPRPRRRRDPELSPTLVVGSDEMGPNSTLDQLRRASVKVEVMATAPTLANLNERIDTWPISWVTRRQGASSRRRLPPRATPWRRRRSRTSPSGRLPAAAQGVSPPASPVATPPPAPSSPWRAASIRWLGSTTTSPSPPNPHHRAAT